MFALVVLAAFVVIGIALHQVLEYSQDRHQREQLRGRSDEMQYMLGRVTPQAWWRVTNKLDALTATAGHTRYWIWSSDPAFTFGAPERVVLDAARDADGYAIAPVGPGGSPMRLLSRDIAANGQMPAMRLVVGLDSTPFRKTLHTFEIALGALLLATIAGVAALGWWIARVGLGPVERMARESAQIGPSTRGLRLALPTQARELDELGTAFNGALDRLDDAYRQLEVFNADVAHELRTPLTNLIGATQVALSRPRAAPELQAVLASNLEELERLRAIVSDMLFLARADQGEHARPPSAVSLADQVRKTTDFMDVLLDEAALQVVIDGDAVAPIETSLFKRAVTNLLQNAIQHSPSGDTVKIAIGSDGHDARVAFSNTAAPIPPDQLARLFDRFYRVDDSRSHSDVNHGLGLAIVKAVAQMHDGTVFATNDGGRFTVGFTVSMG